MSEAIVHRIFFLNEILHRVYKTEKSVYYALPNEHNFKIMIAQSKPEYKRKKFLLSLLLETQYNQDVYSKIVKNQKNIIKLFMKSLQNINLKPFLLLRKIAEYLEDAFENLPH